MTHHASRHFWDCYQGLQPEVQELADKAYALLVSDPNHPSLHFKRVGAYWSVRVGLHYRALAVDAPDGVVWFWIGPRAQYDHLVK